MEKNFNKRYDKYIQSIDELLLVMNKDGWDLEYSGGDVISVTNRIDTRSEVVAVAALDRLYMDRGVRIGSYRFEKNSDGYITKVSFQVKFWKRPRISGSRMREIMNSKRLVDDRVQPLIDYVKSVWRTPGVVRARCGCGGKGRFIHKPRLHEVHFQVGYGTTENNYATCIVFPDYIIVED